MHLRTFLTTLLFATAPVFGMSKKPTVTVRFHTETNSRDGDSFAMPLKLRYAQREAYMERIPDFSEHQIKAIYPFKASDGSWGCAFQLTDQGRIRLDTLSGEKIGRALVVFIATKEGQHQVVDMIIDRVVPDGVITVPRGITDIEMAVMQQQFKVLGKEEKRKFWEPKPEKPKKDDTEWGIDRNRNASPTDRSGSPETLKPKKTQRNTPEPDLPRVAD